MIDLYRVLLRSELLNNPEQAFIEMFLEEWQAEGGQQPLRSITIVDENPETQYMLPEFLLFKKLFERNNLIAVICEVLSQILKRSIIAVYRMIT